MTDEQSHKRILSSILDMVRCSNSLPKLGADFELYNSFPVFNDLLKNEGSRLKNLMNSILKHANTRTSVSSAHSKDDLFEILERANDSLSERIANCLDEAEGRRKPEELIVVSTATKDESKTSAEKSSAFSLMSASWNKLPVPVPKGNNIAFAATSAVVKPIDEELKLLASKNVRRPQIEFQDLIDNTRRPFVTKLKVKHNARTVVQRSNFTVTTTDDSSFDLLEERMVSDFSEHVHPYKHELDHFTVDEKFLGRCENVTEPKDPKTTKLTLVEDQEGLERLCSLLCSVSEFSVDLEHHSYRTFQGLTCLMQISTRDENFLVDTLKVWRNMHILNDPFTRPDILKVFHGADQDVQWLQRDFGIYVVNMFDTGQAMRLLGMARFSLAHLIKSYFDKELNKQFQLADWRIRPLPQVLIDYAVEDTHYLLGCYDRLKNDLIDIGNERKNLLISAFERSRDICAKHYEKPMFDDNDYLKLCTHSRSAKMFNVRQKLALKGLYGWRDGAARLHDESLAYVLPEHMLLQMAQVLPREMQGLLSCCNPVPPPVKQELMELHRIVLAARQAPLDALDETATENRPSESSLDFGRRHPTLMKPHDFSHSAENEDFVSSLLVSIKIDDFSLLKPSSKLFGAQENFKAMKPEDRNSDKSRKLYLTPYEMYLEAEQIRCLKEAEERASKKMQASTSESLQNGETDEKIVHKVQFEIDSTLNYRKRPNEEENQSDGDEKNPGDENEEGNVVPLVFNSKKAEESSKSRKKKRKMLENVESLPAFDYDQARREVEAQNRVNQGKKNDVYDPNRDYLAQRRHKGGKKFGKKASKSSSGR